MGERLLEGQQRNPWESRWNFLGADGSLWSSPTKDCLLTSRNGKDGSKLENVLRE